MSNPILNKRPRSPIQWLMLAVVSSVLVLWGVAWASVPGRPATVDWAASGQSLQLLFPLSQELPVTQVRLDGLQAPDPRQAPWGEMAQRCLNEQVAGKTVRIDPTQAAPDAYGRVWANVWLGRRWLNEDLLVKGCAFVDESARSRLMNSNKLVHAQEKARLLGLGIWDPAQPLRQSPSTFRQASDDAP